MKNISNLLDEDRKRQIEKIVEWAQKHKILVESLTLAQFRKAIKAKG